MSINWLTLSNVSNSDDEPHLIERYLNENGISLTHLDNAKFSYDSSRRLNHCMSFNNLPMLFFDYVGFMVLVHQGLPISACKLCFMMLVNM
jgi:hypothetical protein